MAQSGAFGDGTTTIVLPRTSAGAINETKANYTNRLCECLKRHETKPTERREKRQKRTYEWLFIWANNAERTDWLIDLRSHAKERRFLNAAAKLVGISGPIEQTFGRLLNFFGSLFNAAT